MKKRIEGYRLALEKLQTSMEENIDLEAPELSDEKTAHLLAQAHDAIQDAAQLLDRVASRLE